MRLIDADDVDNHIVGSVNLSGCPTINAIPIPKDATNGDVIKAMFPSIHMIEVFPKVHLFINNNMVARIDINMWNAKYKGVSE